MEIDSSIVAPGVDWDKEYREFQEQEGIPVHTGLAIDDVRELELDDWDRFGGKGAFVNLIGMEGTCDVHILEIPPGEQLRPQHHLHDSLVYVVGGNGFTTIGSGDLQTTFEWGQHAAFLIPENTRYVHANGSEDESVRLVIQTPLPFYYSLHKDHDFIWNNDYDKWEKIAEDDFYAAESQLKKGTGEYRRVHWESNFIPNTLQFDQLEESPGRGGGGSTVRFPFKPSAMWSHMSEFAEGQYKKAHRHLCGANVLILSGEGYSLVWQEGEERTRIDWSPYSLIVPPTLWYHQFFNLSRERARYLVFHTPVKGTGLYRGNNIDTLAARNRRNRIEYHEEDSSIREEFQRELSNVGIEFQMDPEVYEEDYEIAELGGS